MIHRLRKLGTMDYLDLRFIETSNMNTFVQSSTLKDFIFVSKSYMFSI
jgi:hypothetical protein